MDDKSGIPSTEFAPERHLKECVNQTATDPVSYAFGFGRRCGSQDHVFDRLLTTGLELVPVATLARTTYSYSSLV